MTSAEASVPGEMTLTEHLAELRGRLIRIALGLLVGAIIGYVLFPTLLDWLVRPYCDIPAAYRPAGADGGCALVANRVLDAFSVRIKLSLVFGAFVAGPLIFFQAWRFVTPGLTRRERRYALPFVFGSQVMFAAGLGFAYLVIPKGLEILLGFGGEDIAPLLNADAYISFLLTTALAFGLVFELPLVLVFLSLAGVVKARQLRSFRPYALVLNVVVAAIVTPTTDAVTLLFMAVPMALFYEGSILAAWLIERRRRRRT